MARYRRVAFEDRCQIRACLTAKINVETIARELGFHRSTVYRELARNRAASSGTYQAREAETLAQQRRLTCRRKRVLVGELETAVVAKIQQKWSPEQISGRFRREARAQISHETIYRYLRPRWELWSHLRRLGKRGAGRYVARKAKYKDDWRLPIRERPAVINDRSRFGDWERDTMLGLNRRMLIVCAERKSRYVKIDLAREPESVYLTDQTKILLQSTERPVHSLTNDNGCEFKDGFLFQIPVYYCDPRSPQQRGTVENTIGLIRQYLPKRTDLSTLTPEQLREIEDAVNHRPRKTLDYETPHEVFYRQPVALGN